MDCGPSYLAMIAGHYGLHPDIEALRKACALGIDGVSLLGIRAPASKSEYLLEVVDAQAAFPTSGLKRERVMLLAQNS